MAPLVPTFTHDRTDRTFERLYRRYAGDVYRYALAVLRNPADAEDATQTTFLNAYRAIQRGEEPRKPQNWLITIAHNACRKRFAYASRRVKEVPLDDALASLPVPDDERPNVEGVLEALGRLPFNQRAALVMRELEGRSYDEIAETLGTTRSAVEALLFRARRSLNARREALRSLGAVQLPASLTRFFDDPNALVGGGTAAAGTGIAAKVALVLAAGAVAGGGAVADTHMQARAATEPAAIADVSAAALRRPSARMFSLSIFTRKHVATPARRAKASDAPITVARSTRDHTGERGSLEAAPAGDGGSTSSSVSSGSSSSPGTQTTASQAAAPVTSTVQAVAPVQLPATPSVAVPQLPQPPPTPVSTPPVTVPTLP